MIAADLITDTIVPLRTSDTGAEALITMNDFYIRHLPVVNNETLLALISEEDVLNADPASAVGTYFQPNRPAAVLRTTHLYDVMKLVAEHKLSVVPVVDESENYLGMITAEHLLRFFGETGTFRDPGSILVLSMTRHDYSMAEIARIVESEGAILLSSFVQSIPDTSRIEVTIKLNSQQVGAIIATLERYDYTVKASFNERQLQDALKERYDSLINYLNI